MQVKGRIFAWPILVESINVRPTLMSSLRMIFLLLSGGQHRIGERYTADDQAERVVRCISGILNTGATGTGSPRRIEFMFTSEF